MSTQISDPIEAIQKAEHKSQTQIEEATLDFAKQENEMAGKMTKENQEFENELKEKGEEKLKVVKQEAGERFKSQISKGESEKNQVIKKAEEKIGKASDFVVTTFKSHLKM